MNSQSSVPLSVPPPKTRFKLKDVAKRWEKHEKTTEILLKKLGVKPIRLSKRSLLYKLEDIIEAEEKCR